MRKPRAEPDLSLVFHPEHDRSFVHFADSARHPFIAHSDVLGRCNAWWLAEAALLAYWDAGQARAHFSAAGLTADAIAEAGVQAYVARTDDFVIVAFRGTQPDEPQDILDDLIFPLVPSKPPGVNVHAGFLAALDRVWPQLEARLSVLARTRSVWFTGHSLGGALATLAAARFERTAGACTIGCPRVGDVGFARQFDERFGARSLRYVNDSDVVTRVPPPRPYEHVGQARFIDKQGHVGADPPADGLAARLVQLLPFSGNSLLEIVAENLLDHMPRAYPVDMWNDFVDHGDR